MTLNPDFSDKATLEKYSSVFTMSDMEIFVFPELLFPLVIANIMSPLIWTWRDDPWFKDIQKKSFTYKINRIKQYIMDHYVFNLDLDTWGLTTKDREISRFSDFIDLQTLKHSNALFGYEGDKYYFSIDIRRHFGLDKYTSSIIPYWKTETIEAMTAFRFKEPFSSGAGECVSFSVLYVAALFVVGQIPLENIFLISTPLHSQNFIDVHDGVLTNNRRIVTKKMWFNGTSLSTRARRALENEKVTIVSHLSGYIHTVYQDATINQADYKRFSEKLRSFLSTELSPTLFLNFLRYHMKFKKCFQYRHFRNAHDCYIALETIFEYEHNAKYVFSEINRETLLDEIEEEEFSLTPLKNRIILQDIEEYLAKNKITDGNELMTFLKEYTDTDKCSEDENIKLLYESLTEFLKVEPRLPESGKLYIETEKLNIHPEQNRLDIIRLITNKAYENETALLSLYAYRQMDKTDWRPYIKAALERNPVSLLGLKGKTVESVYHQLNDMPNDSIYDKQRLAQPDEVWNFGRGDGLEKAFLLANFLFNDMNDLDLYLIVAREKVTLKSSRRIFEFRSAKELSKEIKLTF